MRWGCLQEERAISAYAHMGPWYHIGSHPTMKVHRREPVARSQLSAQLTQRTEPLHPGQHLWVIAAPCVMTSSPEGCPQCAGSPRLSSGYPKKRFGLSRILATAGPQHSLVRLITCGTRSSGHSTKRVIPRLPLAETSKRCSGGHTLRAQIGVSSEVLDHQSTHLS